MTRQIRLIPAALLFLCGLCWIVAPVGADSAEAVTSSYNCPGGDVPAGTYSSISITGVCYMAVGNVVVKGNLTISAGALLDAVTPGDPPSPATPVVPATLTVGGNVSVGKGAVLLLGCSPNISCAVPPGISFDSIKGNLTAVGAQAVVVHSAQIGGNFSVTGGGGGPAAETCAAQTPGPPIADLEPWSEDANWDFVPVYSDAEDNSVGGNLTMSGLTSCWLGAIRNQVGGDATFNNDTMGDPDGLEIDTNLVNADMTCLSNSPAVQFGDSGAAPNIVGGIAIGQCAFSLVLPSPAPEAGAPFGPVYEHISVSASSLGTYIGTHTTTSSPDTLESVTTTSNDTILAQLSDFVLAGSGLTGSGTYDPTGQPGQSGDAFLATQYPDGWTSFLDYETCDPCSFDGASGAVAIRAYGTLSPKGVESGTFLVTSGGPFLFPSPPQNPGGTYGFGPSTGGLATLVGYGTFTSAGEPSNTLSVVEHLGFASATAALPTCVVGSNPSFVESGIGPTASSSIADVVQVNCKPVYAEQNVTIDATQLDDACQGTLKWYQPSIGLDGTGAQFTVTLDDDGNATAVVLGGPSCAVGTDLIDASVDAPPYTTSSTTFTIVAPHSTPPGVTANPSAEIEDSVSSSVATVVELEFPPVEAGGTVIVKSDELYARCGASLTWYGPGGQTTTGDEAVVKLDDDGNAYVVAVGGPSCAEGSSTITANLKTAPYTSYVGSFLILSPQPSI